MCLDFVYACASMWCLLGGGLHGVYVCGVGHRFLCVGCSVMCVCMGKWQYVCVHECMCEAYVCWCVCCMLWRNEELVSGCVRVHVFYVCV